MTRADSDYYIRKKKLRAATKTKKAAKASFKNSMPSAVPAGSSSARSDKASQHEQTSGGSRPSQSTQPSQTLQTEQPLQLQRFSRPAAPPQNAHAGPSSLAVHSVRPSSLASSLDSIFDSVHEANEDRDEVVVGKGKSGKRKHKEVSSSPAPSPGRTPRENTEQNSAPTKKVKIGELNTANLALAKTEQPSLLQVTSRSTIITDASQLSDRDEPPKRSQPVHRPNLATFGQPEPGILDTPVSTTPTSTLQLAAQGPLSSSIRSDAPPRPIASVSALSHLPIGGFGHSEPPPVLSITPSTASHAPLRNSSPVAPQIDVKPAIEPTPPPGQRGLYVQPKKIAVIDDGAAPAVEARLARLRRAGNTIPPPPIRLGSNSEVIGQTNQSPTAPQIPAKPKALVSIPGVQPQPGSAPAIAPPIQPRGWGGQQPPSGPSRPGYQGLPPKPQAATNRVALPPQKAAFRSGRSPLSQPQIAGPISPIRSPGLLPSLWVEKLVFGKVSLTVILSPQAGLPSGRDRQVPVIPYDTRRDPRL